MAGSAYSIDRAGVQTLGIWLVRRVGYGAMQLSGDKVLGGSSQRKAALDVLRAAVAAGVNHIDTAQFYGPGVVNELIREALYPYPADLAIVTKVGARRDRHGAVLLFDEPNQLRQSIEENLTALGVDRLAAVNLRLMDSAAPGRRFDAQLAALIKARDEGLIDGVGLSNISAAHLTRATAQTHIVCVQNLFNLADQGSADVLALCKQRHIAFVPFFPLGGRRGLSAPAVSAVAARLGVKPAQVALAWLLDLAPNVLLIPGTRSQAHLMENLGAASVELDDAARATLGKAAAVR
ncbi:oxidoreductase [Catenulispora sp. NL8]|uniref:Oxidoreductase n=1 Tax=Catenulispora pinistramenti TaxID=2705254 RepID=A0ABS5L6I5_9ACTN|nr:oxidoreductase [Catenulispora pinistramenti]MBS2553951.1 oxidoreductase [Catenulispora pinistramenti]